MAGLTIGDDGGLKARVSYADNHGKPGSHWIPVSLLQEPHQPVEVAK
ncbi:hypothetical protein [uncultured Cohaesibacter sp.]|nr:hypothetical protein [uncultured Cohaesibacter sp.]